MISGPGLNRIKDHPRSRGVYGRPTNKIGGASGSSPLARGLLSIVVTALSEVRIIPARAGFTTRGWTVLLWCRDHPRSRGVYVSWPVWSPGTPGSSPLARGLLPRINLDIILLGIIPARAGFTIFHASLMIWGWDHPRSRGVYTNSSEAHHSRRGSSPLARGLRCSTRFGSRMSSDHPRSRGVYRARSPRRRDIRGSSPLARGLLETFAEGMSRRRIIPARAGFTGNGFVVCQFVKDHPRSRGVYEVWCPSQTVPKGSSPLARGLPLHRQRTENRRRIIPARAGFTRRRYFRRHQHKDHPRSRGVY